jgi:hypothetical protein
MSEQYYWLHNNTIYVLSYSGDPLQFKEFREVGEKILNSFKFEF